MTDKMIEFPGKHSRIVVKDLKQTAAGRGIEGPKYIGQVVVEKNKSARTAGEMFVKEINGNPKDYRDRINQLKSGFENAIRDGEIDYLPMPPTIRFNGTRILVTEMTRGGQFEIIDAHTLSAERPVLGNSDEVEKQVKSIAAIAYKSGIRLKIDNFAVVMDKKTKEGRAYVLDLSVKPLEKRDTPYLAQLSAESFIDQVIS